MCPPSLRSCGKTPSPTRARAQSVATEGKGTCPRSASEYPWDAEWCAFVANVPLGLLKPFATKSRCSGTVRPKQVYRRGHREPHAPHPPNRWCKCFTVADIYTRVVRAPAGQKSPLAAERFTSVVSASFGRMGPRLPNFAHPFSTCFGLKVPLDRCAPMKLSRL